MKNTMIVDTKLAEEALENAVNLENYDYVYFDIDPDEEDIDQNHVSLTDEAAEILSSYEGSLHLSDLTELSDTAAEYLSKNKGVLQLNGLRELSQSAAESLSRHRGTELHLGEAQGDGYAPVGLQIITDEVAAALSKYEGRLNLSGLKEMSDIAAKNFAAASNLILDLPPVLRGDITFIISEQGLKHLEEKQSLDGSYELREWVEAIRKYRTLDVANAKTILADGCVSLACEHGNEPAEFYESSMFYITEEGAEIMASAYVPIEGFDCLMLDKLGFMSADAAQHLAQLKCGLNFGNLRSLSDEAVRAISLHKGGLLVLGIDNPSEVQLALLSEREGDLELNGLTELSDAAARALAQHTGELYLSGLTGAVRNEQIMRPHPLKGLSDVAAEALAKHKGKINGEDPAVWVKLSIEDIASGIAGCSGLEGWDDPDYYQNFLKKYSLKQ